MLLRLDKMLYYDLGNESLDRAISNVHAGRRFPTPALHVDSLPVLVIATARPAQSIPQVQPWPYRFSYSTVGFSFKKLGRKTADRDRKPQKNCFAVLRQLTTHRNHCSCSGV